MSEVRHVLGISGGKDSAALAVYLQDNYAELPIEFYNTDTGKELDETYDLLNRLESYVGKIERLRAAKNSPEENPFDHFLEQYGGFLPSPKARWCTKKIKLEVFEKFVEEQPAISYVGIRGDENREGYISKKPNIQSIFPFRKNIWSLDVINKVLQNDNRNQLFSLYAKFASPQVFHEAQPIIERTIDKSYFYTRKLNALLDLDVKLFNKVVFEFLKGTDYPVGKLDHFPLIDNDVSIDKEGVFQILEESGVGIPAYYNPIRFEVDGKVGYYNRSRSGCFFCFYQQKIEWVWLYEQHPDLFKKAIAYEKDGYTWMQDETLSQLIKPERIKQIKLDHIEQTEKKKQNSTSNRLVDILDDNSGPGCANCFI